jgi:hypothetical protein
MTKQWCGTVFPNGLPEKGQTVEVKTCWRKGEWETKVFCAYIGYSSYSNSARYYDWFSVYGKPDVENK